MAEKKKRKPSSIRNGQLVRAMLLVGQRVKDRVHTAEDVAQIAGIDKDDIPAMKQRLKMWCEDGQVRKVKNKETGEITEKPVTPLRQTDKFRQFVRNLLLRKYQPSEITDEMFREKLIDLAATINENYEPIAIDGGSRAFEVADNMDDILDAFDL